MKTQIISKVLLPTLIFGAIFNAKGQEYTYHLTVNSSTEREQYFDLEIRSETESSEEKSSIVLTDEKTPFEKNLGMGQHFILVKQEEKGNVITKVFGLVDGKTKGSAQSDDLEAYLTAGPRGQYSAGRKFK